MLDATNIYKICQIHAMLPTAGEGFLLIQKPESDQHQVFLAYVGYFIIVTRATFALQ